jgi:NADPH:quinone reductase-like Zn-dependent oxidoreductase
MKRVRHLGVGRELTIDDVATPRAGATQLLISVEAVGVTLPAVRRLDASTEPLPLAGEVCGTVLEIGSEVTGFGVGDLVTGLCFADAYAEQAVLERAFASAVPSGATAADAIALVRSGLVARGALEAATPSAGESIAVTAAASGVGHIAVQLAKALGANVIGAVSSSSKADFVKGLGADAVCTYDEGPPAPVDAVLEGVGGEQVGRSIKWLAPCGRLVFYGSGGGSINAFDQPERYAAWRDDLWRGYFARTLVPMVDRVYPLGEAAAAHERLLARANRGKVVLAP